MNIKKKAIFSIAFLGMLITPVTSAFADTATVTQSPQISNNQSLKQDSNIDEKVKSDSDKAAQDISDGAIRNKKEFENNANNSAGQAAKDLSDQVVGGAQSAAGNNKDYTGKDLGSIFSKFSALTDTFGSGIISNLVKWVYYGSFIGMLLSFILILISLFAKKMKTFKYVLGLAGSLIVFAVLSGIGGFDLTNNPITEMIKYLFS